jgi:hypothetical protein
MEHVTIQLVSIVASVAVATAWLTWFLREQFSQTHRMFYRVLSLHNREDDDRFAELDTAIWKIHVRNARRDGDEPPERRPIPRRRYLAEDSEEPALGAHGVKP